MKIAVLGAGAWGTALAVAFAPRHEVVLWSRVEAECVAMLRDHENRQYLPGHALPAALSIEPDFERATLGADLAIIATPLVGLRSTMLRLQEQRPRLPFIWVCKGLEAATGLLPHQIVAELGITVAHGILSGPSFAEEVASGLPAAVTLAGSEPAFATRMAQELHGGALRIYASEDLIGAEVGGAVKNVLAIASGICDGLGLGHNARAALMTRGLAEITRFGLALGARRETFMGLAGMGDLLLTCTGDLSRNRRVGLALARGESLAAITHSLGHVAEGVPTAREVARRAAELGVDMPITNAVCAVLDGRLSVHSALEQLMNRDPRSE